MSRGGGHTTANKRGSRALSAALDGVGLMRLLKEPAQVALGIEDGGNGAHPGNRRLGQRDFRAQLDGGKAERRHRFGMPSKFRTKAGVFQRMRPDII